MRDIDKMPPKCHDCPSWEVCDPPYICEDIATDKTTKKNMESPCSSCPFNKYCPCGYSYNNAACITIRSWYERDKNDSERIDRGIEDDATGFDGNYPL